MEDGSGFGSNLAFYSYHDDGSFGGTPLWIDRQDGYIWVSNTISVGRDPITNMEVVTLEYARAHYAPITGGGYLPLTAGINYPLTDALYIDSTTTGLSGSIHLKTPGWPSVTWNTTTNITNGDPGNSAAGYFASQRQGLNRWSVEFGGTEQETGGNQGTNFLINRFADNGGVLYPSPFAINRQLGTVTVATTLMLAGPPTTPNQAATMGYVDSKAGNYLPLGGGIMLGGIVFADVSGQSPADATHHIILHSGFGIGVTTPPASTPNRLNYIADVNSYHAFINGVDTLTIGSSGIQMAANTDVILSRVPTGNMMAVPKQYADLMLPLAGGHMMGGIVFDNGLVNTTAGRTDLHNYIMLYGGYGFSITGNSLNIVTGNQVWFNNSTSGLDFAYMDNYGLHMQGARTVNLGRDPTDKLDAVTKQYADGLIGAAGGPFLPISAGFNNALTGELYLPHIAPTVDEMATPLFWVNGQIQSLQLQINQLEQNLVFVGQLDVPNDVVTFTPGFEISHPGYPSPGPLPDPSSLPKGYYVIVTNPGSPPPGSHIPPVYPPSTYTQHDWLISDGDVWVHLMLGLVYFTASQIAVLPQVYSGATTVQDTLQWLSDTKVNRAGDTMQGQLLLQFPTTDMSAVPWHTLVQQLGGYLALTGGNMLGGISFDGSLATGSSFTDNSRYISLHPAGYGFNVTAYRLNYTAAADASHIFWVGGIMKFYTNVSGLTMTDGDLTLAHDPTSTMHATTKQYVDGRTPFTTDAPNDTRWYGRHAAQWGYVPGLQFIGAGAYDLNAVSPGDFQGILSITNQASPPNWPADDTDATASVLQSFSSNANWRTQLMMGAHQYGPQPALWFRSNDDNYAGGWSPWTRLIGSTGGTFLGSVTFDPGNAVPLYIYGNQPNVATGWGGGLGFNYAAGGAEVDFFNFYGGPSWSFAWWQVTGTNAATRLMTLLPNGDMSVSGSVYTTSVHLSQTPTASDQAATLGQVNAVSASLGNYLLLTGGTLSGNLGLNSAWPTISLDTATGNGRQIMGFTSGSARWLLRIGDNDPESGNNLGASFALYRYGDGGGYLGMPFFISRQTGDASFQGTIFVGTDPTQNLAVATKQYVDAVRTALNGYLPLSGGTLSGLLTAQAGIAVTGGPFTVGWSGAGGAGMVLQAAPGAYRALIWETGGLQLWNIGNSSGEPRDGSNTGGDLAFYRFDDAGNFLGAPLMLMRSSGAVMLDRDPTANLQAATKQYVDSKTAGNYLPLTGGVLSGRLDISYTASTTSCQLFLAPANFSGNALEGKLRFGGTFGVGVGDTGVRLASSLRSGFRSNAWGYEYLDVWINNGVPNDASSDINQVQVASFNRYGITMPASMAITLSADPTANLQAATKQYVDGIILRQGGPWLPLTGGEITGALYVDGVFTAGANSSTLSGIGTWGLALTNNMTQGQGEVDFVSLYTPYGGFRWYQMQAGYVPSVLAQIYPNGTFAIWGLGIVYNGVPHGGNTIGFSWYGGWINAYVDGTFVGYLVTSDFLSQNYLALSGGTMSGGIRFTGVASGWSDLSKQLSLGNNSGFSVDSGGTLNYVIGGVSNVFVAGGFVGQISATGLNNFNIGQTTPGWAKFWGVTIAGGSVAWAAFNFGQQLLITSGGANNTGMGIADSGGTKWIGIHNSGGTLMFSGMPALTDTTTPPREWLTLDDSGAAFSVTMGSLNFGNRIAPNNNPTDTSNHITLWNAGYGFSVTGGTLNVVFGGTCMFMNNGQQQAYFSSSGLTVAPNTTVLLGRDPTSALEAVTLQYFQAHGAPSGAYLPIDGSVAMTGNLRLNAGSVTPTARTITGQTDGVDEWSIFLGGMNHAPFAITKFIGNATYQPGISIDWTTLNVALLGNLTVGANQGAVRLSVGGTFNTGYIEFLRTNGTRRAYLGYATGNTIYLVGEDGVTTFSVSGFIQVGNDPTAAMHVATKQYVDRFLPLSGGTLTGALSLSKAASPAMNVINGMSGNSMRWAVQLGNGTAETGGNAGTDFAIVSYDDGVNNVIGVPLFINRRTLAVNLQGQLTANTAQIGNRLVANGSSNPSVVSWNLAGYASGMWCESGGNLSWGDCDGDGTPRNTRMYLDRNSNLSVNGVYINYVSNSGETHTNTIMNASGAFYVANNYNYYLARDGNSGVWSFVEAGNWNFAVRTNGDISCRNSLYAYGAVFAANDGSFGFYQAGGAQRQFLFAANWFWDWDGNTGALYWYSAAFGGAHWWIRNDGWCFNGWSVVAGHGAYQDLSDERAKADITPSLAGLTEILQINPIRFRRVRNFKPKPKIDDHHDVGFSAQQVRGIIPEAVMVAGFELPGGGGTMDSANPSLSIGTTAIIAALVNSVKELTAMNAALAARVATLETRTLH